MRSGIDRRTSVDAKLLHVVVAQFVGREMHPPGDVEQFERLALGLIDALDAESVAMAAPALCRHPETPGAIIARLFDKGGACACAAFEFAPEVARPDLLARAEYGPFDQAEAIARRAGIDRELAGVLASRGESSVLRALAANPHAIFDHQARRALMLAGRDDPGLGRILLDRTDLDFDPEPLFLAAARDERMGIVLDACRAALAASAGEIAPRAEPAVVARLEAAAIARDLDAFAAVLADALDCRKGRARAMAADAGGEPLVLAFAALGVPAGAATRILLCGAPQIAHDHMRLRALLALMSSTPPRAAAQIVAAVTGSQRVEREGARRTGGREEVHAAARRPARSGVSNVRLDRLA